MKRAADLREVIPALIVLGFVVAVAGLVLELTIAAIKGTASDPIATGVLGTLAGACATALVPLYLKQSAAPPPDPPAPPPSVTHSDLDPRVRPTGYPSSDQRGRDSGHLEMRGPSKWRQS